jgi:hypothetical protein
MMVVEITDEIIGLFGMGFEQQYFQAAQPPVGFRSAAGSLESS